MGAILLSPYFNEVFHAFYFALWEIRFWFWQKVSLNNESDPRCFPHHSHQTMRVSVYLAVWCIWFNDGRIFPLIIFPDWHTFPLFHFFSLFFLCFCAFFLLLLLFVSSEVRIWKITRVKVAVKRINIKNRMKYAKWTN